MAKATVAYGYSTGETVACTVINGANHPDAQDEAVARARKLFAEVMLDLKQAETEAEPEG